jgi:hypothetical protein
MKGQSEILVFILLFLLSISMFVTSVFWSRGIFDRNMDTAKVSSIEKNAKGIDEGLRSVIRFGGMGEADYSVDGPITLVNDNTLEIRTVIASDMSLPKYWVNLSSGYSYIRETIEGDILRVQIVYPEGDQKVSLFTDGPMLAKPSIVRFEKNATSFENGKQTIKIRITFV